MKRPGAIEMLIELAQKASDEQTRILGNALRREANDQERLRLLSDYRGEYMAKYTRLCKEGISAAGMLNFHHFLKKLDVAIAQQMRTLNFTQTLAGAARTALGESERNRQSLVQLRNRRQAAAQSVETKREQKQHDEFATRKSRQAPSLSGGME